MDWSQITYSDGEAPEEAFRQALDIVRDVCGWHIWPRITETITLEPSDSRFLPLPTADRAATLISGGVEGSRITREGLLLRPYGRWDKPTEVVFEHGYTVLPSAVTAVIDSLRRLEGAMAMSQLTAGPFNVSAPKGAEGGATAINDYHRRALAPYMVGEAPW